MIVYLRHSCRFGGQRLSPSPWRQCQQQAGKITGTTPSGYGSILCARPPHYPGTTHTKSRPPRPPPRRTKPTQIPSGRLKFRYHGAFVGATMRIDYYRGSSVVWATHRSSYGARIYRRRLQKDLANVIPTFTASSCLEPRLLS